MNKKKRLNIFVESQHPCLAPIAMHVPIFDLNPCSFNPGVAKLSADYTGKTIEMLDQLGGGVVTIHPGKRTAKRPVGPLDRARLAGLSGCRLPMRIWHRCHGRH